MTVEIEIRIKYCTRKESVVGPALYSLNGDRDRIVGVGVGRKDQSNKCF